MFPPRVFSLFLMPVGLYQNRFIIGVRHETRFAFVGFTDVFSFAIIHRDLIPILAFAAQMLTSVVSMKMQKKLNPEAPSMAGMMLTMPLLSLFIGFSLPGAVGFYWICSSLIGSGIQTAVQIFYGPHKMLAKERAKSIISVWEAENKYIENRVEDNSAAE